MYFLRWPPPEQPSSFRYACAARASPDAPTRHQSRRKAQPAAISAFAAVPHPLYFLRMQRHHRCYRHGAARPYQTFGCE